MTKTCRGGILAILVGAVMVIPAISSASPIHLAPQWPGGGLNGSEAARNARHEAHASQQSSRSDHFEEAEPDGLAFDVLFNDLVGPLTPPITLPIAQMDGALLGLSQLPTIFEPAGAPTLFDPQFLHDPALSLPDATDLTLTANPAVLTPVPEPGSLFLVGSGIAAAIVKVRRQRREP